MVEAELFEDALPRAATQTEAESPIVEELTNGRGKGVYVTRLHQNAAVLQRLVNAADVAGHHRALARHRFDDRVRKGFRDAGEEDDVGVRIRARNVANRGPHRHNVIQVQLATEL